MINSSQSLILIRGIPGSGKSTLAKELQFYRKHPTVVLEADQFFISITGDYKFDKSKISNAHEWCQHQTKCNLEIGLSVIVANTFIQRWELIPYRVLAARLDVPMTTIVANGEYESIHNVPNETIERMRMQFEL